MVFTCGMTNPMGTQNPMGMGMGTGMNFFLWVWIQVQISTHSPFVDGRVIALLDPNLTCCHP
jgi:hypothetical protein